MPDLKGITMASIQARRRTDDTISYRVQFRMDKRMRSKSFADPKGAQQFVDLIDRVGPFVAAGVWERRAGTQRRLLYVSRVGRDVPR